MREVQIKEAHEMTVVIETKSVIQVWKIAEKWHKMSEYILNANHYKGVCLAKQHTNR